MLRSASAGSPGTLADHDRVPVARDRRVGRALAEPRAPLAVGVDALLALAVGRGDGREHRQALERERRRELELEHERPARHLRHDVDALLLELLGELERARGVRRGRTVPASSAVQLTVLPIACEMSASCGMKRSRPTVACMSAVIELGEAARERLHLGERRGAARNGLARITDVGRRASRWRSRCAPAASAPRTIACICAISSGVASRSVASSPIT